MLIDILQTIQSNPDSNDFRPLGRLLKRLRPREKAHPQAATAHLESLITLLEEMPELCISLLQYLNHLLSTRQHIHLYTDTGILDSETLGAGISRRLSERLLPRVSDDNYLDDAFARLIRRGRDSYWIEAIDDACWARLFSLLLNQPVANPCRAHCQLEQLKALRVLAHRVSAMGIESELVRHYPAVEAFESPFLALSSETDRFVRHQRERLQGLREDSIDHLQIAVLMDQCAEVLRKIKRQSARHGVSVSLTYLMVRLEQSLSRMHDLLELLDDSASADLPLLMARFLKEMCRAENADRSARQLFSRHTHLLARNITEHAGETGGHYVTTTIAGYFDMLRSASKAGVIVAFMALFKTLAGRLSLAPLGQAFLYSMNYSFGFMFIHILQGTIATKQPAMTASRIAASIEDAHDGKAERHLGNLAQLCIDIFRSQLVAITGNVAVAFPVAIAVGMCWQLLNGTPPANVSKSMHMLSDLDPLHSLAIFHAAIAGVCLFLSGIISGYYDNSAIYRRIPERVAATRLLQRLSPRWRERIRQYLQHNLGALAGNFYFGIMLGSMSTLGFILGLPLDIRHISFATANFAYAIVGLNFAPDWHVYLVSIIGIAAIGITNLAVSFGLALMLALKSRGVRFRLWIPLLKIIVQRLLTSPHDFFWPPKVVIEKH